MFKIKRIRPIRFNNVFSMPACSISSMFFNGFRSAAKSSSLEKFEYNLMCCWCRKFLWISMEIFWLLKKMKELEK